MKLDLYDVLLESLSTAGVAYCHWKSNWKIGKRPTWSLPEHDDLDLLVAPEDRDRFESTIHSLGFKAARPTRTEAALHYFGLQEESLQLLHLHVYFGIVTGGSILKNYRLPVSNALLQSAHENQDLPMPTLPVELAVFILRKLLEHTSWFEYLLLRRERREVRKEIQWLMADPRNMDRACRLVREWFPNITCEDFLSWGGLFLQHGVSLRCRRAGLRLGRALKGYRINTGLKPGLIRIFRIAKYLVSSFLQRALKRPRGRTLIHGGCIIAVIGADATGKTTLCDALQHVLSKNFRIARYHGGFPPPSLLTILPRILVPMLTRLIPSFMAVHAPVELPDSSERDCHAVGYLARWSFIIRSWMVGYDRTRWLKRVMRQVSTGVMVIADRYPNRMIGISHEPQANMHGLVLESVSLASALVASERRMRQGVPPADMTIFLEVAVDEAVARNTKREKAHKEDAATVRRRHAQNQLMPCDSLSTLRLDTGAGVDFTLRRALTFIWKRL